MRVKKILGPFRISLENSKANQANLHLDWAELAELFTSQANPKRPSGSFSVFYILFFFNGIIKTHAPHFFHIIRNSSIARVRYMVNIVMIFSGFVSLSHSFLY